MRSILSFAVVLALSAPAAGADAVDPAPVGSEWVGTWKRFSSKAKPGERLTSTDATLKVIERDGTKIKAELWFTGRERGLLLEGTVTPTGAENFKATVAKVIKGDFDNDIVGRAVAEGYMRNGAFKATHRIPGGARFGEFDLKRKDDK